MSICFYIFLSGLLIFLLALASEKANTLRNKKWCNHFGLHYTEIPWGLICVVWWGIDDKGNWYTRGDDGFPRLVKYANKNEG